MAPEKKTRTGYVSESSIESTSASKSWGTQGWWFSMLRTTHASSSKSKHQASSNYNTTITTGIASSE
eukprot:scaffold237381_cov25-Tisochrysis_lutea.AAC.1